MTQLCWKNYFAQPIVKVIGKRKPFKTNNSSGVLYGLDISNAPTTGGGERCHECFGGKVIAQQLMSFTIVLNKVMLNRKALFAALL